MHLARCSVALVALLVGVTGAVGQGQKEPPTLGGKELARPENLDSKAYQAWVQKLTKMYHGKTARLSMRVDAVSEEKDRNRITVVGDIKYTDDNGKEKALRMFAYFPLNDKEIKKYTPTDMGRKKYQVLIEGKADVQLIGRADHPLNLLNCKVVEAELIKK